LPLEKLVIKISSNFRFLFAFRLNFMEMCGSFWTNLCNLRYVVAFIYVATLTSCMSVLHCLLFHSCTALRSEYNYWILCCHSCFGNFFALFMCLPELLSGKACTAIILTPVLPVFVRLTCESYVVTPVLTIFVHRRYLRLINSHVIFLSPIDLTNVYAMTR